MRQHKYRPMSSSTKNEEDIPSSPRTCTLRCHNRRNHGPIILCSARKKTVMPASWISRCVTSKPDETMAVAMPSNTQPTTSSIAAELMPITPIAVRSSFISNRMRPMIGSAEIESAMQRKN